MTFSEYTDTWFDRLADCKLADSVVAKLREAIAVTPNEPGLRKLRVVVAELPADCAEPLTAHIDAVLLGKIAEEFAIVFSHSGGQPLANGREVSATGELFSMVRQAVNYSRD